MRIVVKVRIKKRMIWRAKRKKKRISDWLIEVRERKRIKGLEKKQVLKVAVRIKIKVEGKISMLIRMK